MRVPHQAPVLDVETVPSREEGWGRQREVTVTPYGPLGGRISEVMRTLVSQDSSWFPLRVSLLWGHLTLAVGALVLLGGWLRRKVSERSPQVLRPSHSARLAC